MPDKQEDESQAANPAYPRPVHRLEVTPLYNRQIHSSANQIRQPYQPTSHKPPTRPVPKAAEWRGWKRATGEGRRTPGPGCPHPAPSEDANLPCDLCVRSRAGNAKKKSNRWIPIVLVIAVIRAELKGLDGIHDLHPLHW